MNLTCLGSGSSGNCYLLEHDGEILILDVGVKWKTIQQALNYDISHVVGAVITHDHADHNRAVKDLILTGIPFFTPLFYTDVQRMKYGGFAIAAVPLKSKDGKWLHTNGDGSECKIYGFLISVGGRRLAYFTDFEYLPMRISQKTPVTDFLIACNHEDDMEYEDSAKEYHSVLGHSALSTVKEIVRANQTDALQNVILCHLTWAADRGKMLREITEVVGEAVNVTVAESGKTYLL